MSIYSIQLEKHVLAGLLKYPKMFYDVAPHVSEQDFFNDFHGTVYGLFKHSMLNSEDASILFLSEKIKDLGISFNEDINVFEYLTNLTHIKITEETLLEACKALKKTTVRREISETADKIKVLMKEGADKSPDELIAAADALYNGKISFFGLVEEPFNIFDNIEEVIEKLGNNPVEEIGFKTPYSEFNRKYGGLMRGEISAFVARPGVGKSSLLVDLCVKTCNVVNKDINCLYLDTEMQTIVVQQRLVAAMTGVPMWYVASGNWRKDERMTEKIRAAWITIKGWRFHHMHVANKTTEDIQSISRRWFYSKIGRGNKAIIAYDYVKATGETINDSNKEHQVIGKKVDAFKRTAEEIDCPWLTSMQMNRMGENQGKKVGTFSDDSSAISLSDRLQWFAAFVGIWRRKTLDEIAVDGTKYGTHKLIPTKTRFQGKDAAGHMDVVQRTVNGEKVYQQNFINFQVENFAVEERGSLDDIIQEENLKIQAEGGDEEKEEHL